jgi:hypothetical protein
MILPALSSGPRKSLDLRRPYRSLLLLVIAVFIPEGLPCAIDAVSQRRRWVLVDCDQERVRISAKNPAQTSASFGEAVQERADVRDFSCFAAISASVGFLAESHLGSSIYLFLLGQAVAPETPQSAPEVMRTSAINYAFQIGGG